MAKVKLNIVKGKSPVTKADIYYVQTKATGVMSVDDLVTNICKEQQVPRIYAEGVLKYLATALFDYAKAGLSVQIPSLGTFRVVVSSKSVDSKDKCNATLVENVKLSLQPCQELKEQMRGLRFEVVNEVVNTDSTAEEVTPEQSEQHDDENENNNDNNGGFTPPSFG